MNEQETRENAIYNMVIDTYRYLYSTLPSYYEVVKDIRSGRYSDLAKLYDTGYRKVDKDGVFHIDISDELTKDFFQNEIKEARKEAIKEFVQTVKRCLPNEPYLHTWLREIAFGKFGVEVEE